MSEPDASWVEVAWAARERQAVFRLAYRTGMTAAEAVEQCGLRVRFPDIPDVLDLGIWGRPVGTGYELAPGDRVEVYRPLVYDPKVERRRRASLSRRAAGA